MNNPAQWRGLSDALDVLNFVGIDIQRADAIAFAPWPCHGVVWGAALRDSIASKIRGIPGDFGEQKDKLIETVTLRGFLGTCGGA